MMQKTLLSVDLFAWGYTSDFYMLLRRGYRAEALGILSISFCLHLERWILARQVVVPQGR